MTLDSTTYNDQHNRVNRWRKVQLLFEEIFISLYPCSSVCADRSEVHCVSYLNHHYSSPIGTSTRGISVRHTKCVTIHSQRQSPRHWETRSYIVLTSFYHVCRVESKRRALTSTVGRLPSGSQPTRFGIRFPSCRNDLVVHFFVLDVDVSGWINVYVSHV